MYCGPHCAILLGTDLAADLYMVLIRCGERARDDALAAESDSDGAPAADSLYA
eukprot:COSAG06_NODE_65226_length_257_cov_1.031646_1_plen_52_part_01